MSRHAVITALMKKARRSKAGHAIGTIRFPIVKGSDSDFLHAGKFTAESVSLGGSSCLGENEELPGFISDVHIGEYMSFGTIPYNCDGNK